jgi:hypothetical protein
VSKKLFKFFEISGAWECVRALLGVSGALHQHNVKPCFRRGLSLLKDIRGKENVLATNRFFDETVTSRLTFGAGGGV